MKCSKKVSIAEAASMVQDGDIIAIGGFVIWRKPMSVIYELIRQKKRDLHMISLNQAFDADMLIGAGCISVLEGNYCGFEIYGKVGNNYARSIQDKSIVFEDWSHYHQVMRFEAAAIGLPYMPTSSALGTDLLNPEYDMMKRAGLRDGKNPYIPKEKFKIIKDPFFDGNDTVLVPAAKANIGIVQVQQVGDQGTVRMSGQTAPDVQTMKAADKLIVVAEEIVPEEYLRHNCDANSLCMLYPDAIVESPFGGHPSGVHQYYDADGEFIADYHNRTRTQEGFDEWADEWIFGVKNFDEYLDKIGGSKLVNLKANSVYKWSTSVKRSVR